MSKYTISESWLALLHDAIFFDLPREPDTEWDYLYKKLGPCRIQYSRMITGWEFHNLAQMVCKVYRKCNWVPPQELEDCEMYMYGETR